MIFPRVWLLFSLFVCAFAGIQELLDQTKVVTDSLMTAKRQAESLELSYLFNIPPLISLQVKLLRLHSDLVDSTNMMKAAEPIPANETVAVLTAILKLKKPVEDTIKIIEAKKPVFENAIFGVGSVTVLVKGMLRLLRDDVADFGDALLEKIPKEYMNPTQFTLDIINKAFEAALQGAYSEITLVSCPGR